MSLGSWLKNLFAKSQGSVDFGDVGEPEDDGGDLFDSVAQTATPDQLREMALGPRPPLVDELLASDSVMAAPPTAATTLLEITRNKDSDAHALERVIRDSAALTTAILRAANSARFAGANEVVDLRLAIVRLGFNEVAFIGIATSILSRAAAGDAVARALSTRGTEVGFMARHLAYEWDGIEAEAAFSAGVLHDLGSLALLDRDRKAWLEIHDDDGNLHEGVWVERERWGTDHPAVGAHLLDSWGFPALVVAVTAAHVDVERVFDRPELLEVLRLVACVRLAEEFRADLLRHDRFRPAAGEALAASTWGQILHLDPKTIERLWTELQRVLHETGRVFDFEGTKHTRKRKMVAF